MSSYAQFLAIRGGFNWSSVTMKDVTNFYTGYSSIEINNKSIFRIQAGINAEFPLGPNLKWLTMETGLIIKTKGSDFSATGHGGKYNSTGYLFSNFDGETNLYYLDIPLSVKMYTSVEKTSLYFEFGTYLGIGLAGTQSHTSNDPQGSRKITWGFLPENDYKRFDYGISMGIGMNIKPIQIGLSYYLGLANIDPSGQRIAHNHVFSVFMEFMILRKDKSLDTRNKL
jgi:Outer membrane protein beta-barrel domain